MESINEEKNKKWLTFKIWSRKVDFKILKFITVLVIIIASIIIIKDEITWQFNSNENGLSSESTEQNSEEKSCNVFGIELHGNLTTYIPPTNLDKDGNVLEDQTASENIVYSINEAEKDDNIKAIILEIDSYGGSPVAAEEVSNALKNVKKPTVALIRDGGVSAAYFAATGANKIFASKNSDVGSIAVTMSYLDNVRQNQKEGLTYNQLSSGKFKDTGDPDKALSAEEIKLLMRDVNIIHQNFTKAVAENRKLDIKKVEGLADGSTMLGEMALNNGLIDEIGGLFEVKKYLKEKIGEDVEICW